MAISNFLVYSYTDKLFTERQFTALGFNRASTNKTSGAAFWHNHNCIVLLKPDNFDGLSGLSFVTSEKIINRTNAQYDDATGWFQFGDKLKFYLQTESTIKTVIQNEYQTTPILDAISTGVDKFGGVVLNLNQICDKEILSALEFKTMSSDRYLKYISQNNFSLYLDTYNKIQSSTVYVDCYDIFKNIAMLSLDSTIQMKQYTDTFANFGNLTHKINGYNCTAIGNKDSYTIEKMIIDCPKNVNFILRQRSKKITINEHTLQKHYDIHTQTKL